MRIRSIKPEFYRSDDISVLDWESRFIFIALWSYVDDNGVGVDKLSAIVADLFADDLERDARETFARVSRGLETLSAAGRITRYTVDGRNFLHVTNWERHQRIDRPNKPRYPLPTTDDTENRESVARVSRECRETPSTGTGEQGNRGTGEQGNSFPRKRGTRIPDDFSATDEMLTWAAEKAPYADAERETEKFIDYWSALSGSRGTKADWVKTWRNWMRKASDDCPPWKRGNVHQLRPATDQAIDEWVADRMRYFQPPPFPDELSGDRDGQQKWITDHRDQERDRLRQLRADQLGKATA